MLLGHMKNVIDKPFLLIGHASRVVQMNILNFHRNKNTIFTIYCHVLLAGKKKKKKNYMRNL
jgi:hypothetical protein